MQIDLVTPTGAVFSGEIDEVVIPGALGEMGIMPGHIPAITALDIGEITIRQNKQAHYFAVEGGFLEIAKDRINVITETALKPGDIDLEEAKTLHQQAETALKETSDQGPAESRVLLADLKRAETLLLVGSRR